MSHKERMKILKYNNPSTTSIKDQAKHCNDITKGRKQSTANFTPKDMPLKNLK